MKDNQNIEKVSQIRFFDPLGDGVATLIKIEDSFYLVTGEDLEHSERVHIADDIGTAYEKFSVFFYRQCKEELTDEERLISEKNYQKLSIKEEE